MTPRIALIALALTLVPALGHAQNGTVTITNTDPAMVRAIIAVQNQAHGTAPGTGVASAHQQGANNAAGIGQFGGGAQHAQVSQTGCNNTATSIQTAPNTVNLLVQGGCNNAHHSVQTQANTATFTFQMGQ